MLTACAGFSRRIFYSRRRKNMRLIARGTKTIAGLPLPTPGTEEEKHMLGALELAEMGRETCSPNPMVGALVVAGGEVVGDGFHERAGGRTRRSARWRWRGRGRREPRST